MERLLQIGKEFGMEGEKLLEFVEKQQKLEEVKEEKRLKLEEERRREEEEKGEKRREKIRPGSGTVKAERSY